MPLSSTAIDVGLLYTEYGAWLRAWLFRRTRCTQDAADLTQDTFSRLIEHRPRQAVRDSRAYLATIARRLLIDGIRRREIEAAVIDACAACQDSIDRLTPERIAEAVQMLDAVMRIIDGLPEQAKAAFLLRRVEGLEQREIAERLDVSLSTVKRYIALAYARCHAISCAD